MPSELQVMSWLNNNFVDSYLPQFRALGVRVASDFALVTAEDLTAMQMAPIDSRRVLAAAKADFPPAPLPAVAASALPTATPPPEPSSHPLPYTPFLKALDATNTNVGESNWLDLAVPPLPVEAKSISISPVLGVKSLVAKGWLKDVTGAVCDDSEEVSIVSACNFALLPYDRDKNEDGLHAVLTPYTNLSKALLGISVARNAHDASTVGAKRPDAVGIFDGSVVIWRQEEKSDADAMETACGELTENMKKWSVDFYGPLFWVLGFAVADSLVRVFQLQRLGSDGVGKKIVRRLNLNSVNDRVELLKVHACYSRYLRKRRNDGDFNEKVCRLAPLIKHARQDGKTSQSWTTAY